MYMYSTLVTLLSARSMRIDLVSVAPYSSAIAAFHSPSLSKSVPTSSVCHHCLCEEFLPSLFVLNYKAPTLNFMSASSLSLWVLWKSCISCIHYNWEMGVGNQWIKLGRWKLGLGSWNYGKWEFRNIGEMGALEHRRLGYVVLTPKILWDQKLVDCCLGSLCEEK
jgi:hypothetical protein